MTHTLVFGRRFIAKSRYEFAKALLPDSDVHLWSDERLTGMKSSNWWGPYFYGALKEIRNSESQHHHNANALKDITRRCRYLRELPEEISIELVLAAFKAWESIIKKYNYSYILTLPVDSFVIDTLLQTGKRLNIPALYPVGTPFSGKIRFTTKGEVLGNVHEEKDKQDVENYLKTLTEDNYKPDWLIGTKSSPLKTAFRRAVIDAFKMPAFSLYRLFFKDPYSFSFPKRKYYEARMFTTLRRMRAAIKIEKNAIIQLPEKFALLPLQFYPEATTDYWVPEIEVTNHHKNVLEIARVIAQHMPILIKEHPAALAKRDHRIIEELINMKNVHFAPSLAPMGNLVKRATLVVGNGSTTLLQAMLLNINVLFLGTPYFGALDRPVIKTLDPKEIESKFFEAIDKGSISRPQSIEILTNLYSSTAEGNMGNYTPIGENSNLGKYRIDVSPRLEKLFHTSIEELKKKDS